METARKRPTMAPSKMAAPEARATATIDPWAWAERSGSPDASLRESLGIEARARLKLLQRAATNFALRLPSVPEWTAFLRTEIIPVYNAIMPDEPMCLECGKRIARKKTAKHVCSPECASRLAGRPRKGSGSPGGHEAGETAKITLGDIALLGARKSK